MSIRQGLYSGLLSYYPEEAIVMSKDYELVYRDRNDAIYGKDKLLVPVHQVEDRIDFLRNFK
ncbi:MAG TPA: hypothetical protein VHO03_08915 [Ignavibacteriales bacterium]|nr:hypothetical protein [Ignavibacteriales bacterium]